MIMLHDLKVELEGKGILFCFCGPMTQDIVVGIGETLKQKMKMEETSATTSIKVFSIFVEQMQNVIFYSTERTVTPQGELSLGIIVVGKTEENYYVLCGNQINKRQADRLEPQLSELKTMDKAQMKEMYKAKRKQGPDEESKGAGLGFLEMARKASQPIEYEIKQLNDEDYFFSIKITI